MADFTNGICGCTNNCGLCLLGYFCPCYLTGKVAESVGKNCLLFGLLAITPIRLCSNALLRQAVREKYGIDGSIVSDVVCGCCCSLCASVQEGNEVVIKGDAPPGTFCMSRE